MQKNAINQAKRIAQTGMTLQSRAAEGGVRSMVFSASGRTRAQRGMTLVEIMVVIAIIGMVMGAVVVGAIPMLEKARCKTAWNESQVVGQAIATYQTESNGDCPKAMEELVTGKYLSKAPVDPWGQPLQFKCPGDNNTDSADVWSKGKNKQDGDEDDVKGWVKLEEACKK